MKRQLFTAALSVALSCAAAAPAFAGVWLHDSGSGKWHYDYLGRGTDAGFLKSQWAWIDGNHDGISECYYFDADGNMLASTEAEGCTLNANGQWTVNGVVQTKQEGVTVSSAAATELVSDAPAESNYYARFDSAETASGLQWSDGFVLSGDLSHAAYAVFSLDKKYSAMTLTFSPAAGQTGAQKGRVTVTGLTTGKSLYRSELLAPTADPVSATFSVKNEERVRISILRGCDFLFDSVIVQ